MNKASLFFLFVFISSTITAQKGFEVKIKLDGIGENKIRIYSQRNNKYVIDTLTQQSDKSFLWKGLLKILNLLE